MDGGPEGHAGWNERRQGQPQRRETHCGRLAEEHDGAARSVKQRRAGSRFRYRRRRQAAPYLRLAQDAPFHVIFLAALWTTLVGAGVLATIGTIALGTDTESDRISVRTAVEADFSGSWFPSTHGSSIYQLHSATLLDLITTTTSSRRAHATFCYSRPWPTFAHANLQPQRTCFDSRIYTLSLLATRSSLPTARQLQPAPPITCNRSPARPHRTASSSLPASLRPAAPPACRPTCPGRLAWTRPLLCRAAQRLHASKPCQAGSHGTLQKYHLEENTNKTSPILRCNNAFEEPDGYACASASCMAPALPSRPSLRTSSRPSSRAPSRTSPGASAVHQQIAPPLARAGLKTAVNVIHA
jgi:hypothetical protein